MLSTAGRGPNYIQVDCTGSNCTGYKQKKKKKKVQMSNTSDWKRNRNKSFVKQDGPTSSEFT